MPIRHACFISYCHGQNELVRSFIDQLVTALKNYLEPLLDEGVYIDRDRLKPGYQYNDELARAICESVCMIVVYSPRYEGHEYCLREFTAMEIVEKRRLERLGPAGHGRGFIIPIVFSGDVSHLPPRIKAITHCCDLSKFTLISREISRNRDFVPKIRDVCQTIYEMYKILRPLMNALDATFDCVAFSMPPAERLMPWRPGAAHLTIPFPGREASA